jgi:hypothetical protein
MPWPKLLRRNTEPSTTPADRSGTEIIELDLPGWVEGEESGGLRSWRDPDGDLLTLATNVGSVLMGPITDERARRTAREIAVAGGGGLIEAEQGQCHAGRTVTLIYKRLLRPALQAVAQARVRIHGNADCDQGRTQRSCVDGRRRGTQHDGHA